MATAGTIPSITVIDSGQVLDYHSSELWRKGAGKTDGAVYVLRLDQSRVPLGIEERVQHAPRGEEAKRCSTSVTHRHRKVRERCRSQHCVGALPLLGVGFLSFSPCSWAIAIEIGNIVLSPSIGN